MIVVIWSLMMIESVKYHWFIYKTSEKRQMWIIRISTKENLYVQMNPISLNWNAIDPFIVETEENLFYHCNLVCTRVLTVSSFFSFLWNMHLQLACSICLSVWIWTLYLSCDDKYLSPHSLLVIFSQVGTYWFLLGE